MDYELMMIFGFVLVIVMVVLTFGTIAGQRDRAHKLRKLELEARVEEAKASRANADSEAQRKLEERVQVLERIATDRGADLAREIEDLRRDPAMRTKEIAQ